MDQYIIVKYIKKQWVVYTWITTNRFNNMEKYTLY